MKLIAYKLVNGRKETVMEFDHYCKDDKELARKQLHKMNIEFDGIDSVTYTFKGLPR